MVPVLLPITIVLEAEEQTGNGSHSPVARGDPGRSSYNLPSSLTKSFLIARAGSKGNGLIRELPNSPRLYLFYLLLLGACSRAQGQMKSPPSSRGDGSVTPVSSSGNGPLWDEGYADHQRGKKENKT